MKTISICRSFVASIVMLTVGCGGGDEQTGPAAPGGATNGETPAVGENGQSPATPASEETSAADGPSVVSTMPANGAKGVKSDANVVVKFDRPMDTASVVAAYSSAELATGDVTFSWNGKDDELTITPVKPLAYAEGDANVAAKAYAVAISTAAKDKAGHALLKSHVLSFATARRITANLPMTSVMTGRALSNNTFSSSVLAAGDVMTADGEREARALFTFVVSTLPANADIQKGTLFAAISKTDGTPDASLGAISAEQVFYSIGLEGFAAEPVSGVQTSLMLAFVGQSSPSYRTADVTAILKDDIANHVARNDRTQYRLRYTGGQNNDAATDLVTYDKAETKLQVVYVVE